MKSAIKITLVCGTVLLVLAIMRFQYHRWCDQERQRVQPQFEHAQLECAQAGLLPVYQPPRLPEVSDQDNFAACPPLQNYLARSKSRPAANDKPGEDAKVKEIYINNEYLTALRHRYSAYKVPAFQQAMRWIDSNYVDGVRTRLPANVLGGMSEKRGWESEVAKAAHSLENILESLDQQRELIPQLQMAAQRKMLSLPDRETNNQALKKNVLHQLDLYNRLLVAKAVVALLRGDGSNACNDVETSIKLVQLMLPLTSQYEPDDDYSYPIDPDDSLPSVIWLGSVLKTWNEDQLRRIQEQMSIKLLTNVYNMAVAMEFHQTWDHLNGGRYNRYQYDWPYVNNLSYSVERDELSKVENNWLVSEGPDAWSMENSVNYAHFCLDNLKQLGADLQKESSQRHYKNAFDRALWYPPVSKTNIVAMQVARFKNLRRIQRKCSIQVMYQQAQLACALERYRLSQGRYPENLQALSPQFINPIPLDPVDGLPMRYRRTADGYYALYSIGPNDQDEGGLNHVESTIKKGEDCGEDYDWVWKFSQEYKSRPTWW